MSVLRCLIACCVASTILTAGAAQAAPWQFWIGLGYAHGLNESVPGGGLRGAYGSYEDDMPAGGVTAQIGATKSLGPALGVGAEVGYLQLGYSSDEKLCVPGTYCGTYTRELGVFLVQATGQLSWAPLKAGMPDLVVLAGGGLYGVSVEVHARDEADCACGPEGDFGVRLDGGLGGNAGLALSIAAPGSSQRFEIAGRYHVVATSPEPLSLITLGVRWWFR